MSINATHTRFTSKLHGIVLLAFIVRLYLYISLNTIHPYVGKTKTGSKVAQGARRALGEPRTRHLSPDSTGARRV